MFSSVVAAKSRAYVNGKFIMFSVLSVLVVNSREFFGKNGVIMNLVLVKMIVNKILYVNIF